MEAVFFALDIIGMVLLLYWSILNDQREPGDPSIGLFAYRDSTRRRSPSNTRRTSSRPSRRNR